MAGGTPGQVDPRLAESTDVVRGQLQDQTNDFYNQSRDAANRVQTNFGQFNPSLNSNYGPGATLQTEFRGPQFSNQLDQYSQNVLSQGVQAQNQRLNAQQQQMSQQFRNSPALLQVLQSQAAAQSQLGQNPLLFQAATAQRGREAQEYQLGQSAQAQTNQSRLAQSQEAQRAIQLANQTRLQQSEIGANLQGMGNSALGQQLGMQGAPLQAKQNLLSVLSALGAASAAGNTKPGDPLQPFKDYTGVGQILKALGL